MPASSHSSLSGPTACLVKHATVFRHPSSAAARRRLFCPPRPAKHDSASRRWPKVVDLLSRFDCLTARHAPLFVAFAKRNPLLAQLDEALIEIGFQRSLAKRVDLRLQFEAVSRLDDDERQVVRELIDGMLLKHEARRYAARPAKATG